MQPNYSASDKWLSRIVLAGVVLVCAVAVSPNPADPDLWGHVRYGRDALREGVSPTTTYSFTADGYRWINHENLAELSLALLVDTLGPIGLLIVKCLLGVGVVILVMRHALRGGAGLMTVTIIALLTAANLSYHWSCRPQIFTFVYFALLVALLNYAFTGWFRYSSSRMRCLWLAPVLFFFWANTHGGFVAGYAIYVAYLGCRGLEAFCSQGRQSWGILQRLTLMAVVAGLATLINPYGPDLHLWLVQSLSRPRPEIRDWWPPDLFSTLFLPLWLIALTFVAAILGTRKPRDFTQLALLLLTLWQSLEHQRHIPFFAILFGFWMPTHLHSLLMRLRVDLPESSLKPRGGQSSAGQSSAGQSSPGRSHAPWLAMGVTLVFILLGGRLYFRLSDLPVEKSQYPISAAQFIADRGLRGKMVVTYNWAQYVIDAFGGGGGSAKIRVGFDGRFRTCYPQEIVDMHFDFVLGQGRPGQRYRGADSAKPDPFRVLEFKHPDLVLIHRRQSHSVQVMQQQTDKWTLLYQDEIAQLWGRTSKYDNPQRADYLPPSRRSITNTAQTGSVTWPALPSIPSPYGPSKTALKPFRQRIATTNQQS